MRQAFALNSEAFRIAPFYSEEIDRGAFAGILAPLLADFAHTGNDIGDIVEELVGVSEIDPCHLQTVASASSAPVRMPPILMAAP
jgi:hypothetical protein